MIRIFKVLEEMFVTKGGIDIVLFCGDVLEINDDHIPMCAFSKNQFIVGLEELIKHNKIREILPDKKPIILGGISTEEFTNNLKHMNNVLNEKSDSILDYEKKYNMWDATHLMKNHDIKMADSKFGFVWEYYSESNTLWTETFDEVRNDSSDCFIEDLFDGEFGYVDSLDLTFTLVKPVEKVEEKWIRINTPKDLCTAIVKGKTIRWGDGERITKYDDKQIVILFNVLENEFYTIEYLED